VESRKKIQKSKKRLLVTDYDLTLLAYNGTDVEMLSLPLIDFVMMKHYDGFYGCTHRAYRNLNYVDDNRDIIQHAFKVQEKKSRPKNVKLKFFVHDGTGDDAKINRVQEEKCGRTRKLG
jgi:hypothetical protein